MAFSIPTISLSKPKQETVQALRDASLTSGFFQLTDIEPHVSRELILQMFDETRKFFQLPSSEKEKVTKRNHLVGGYEGFRFYDLAKTGDGGKKGEVDDEDGGWNEGFAIAPEWGTNCFPQANPGDNKTEGTDAFDPATFEATCKAYFHAVQELGRHLLSLIAQGLGIEQDFFEGYLDHQNSFCRLTHYYRADTEGAPIPTKVEIGAAPHTDWGALTLLVQDEIGGLQVYDRALNQWHDVPPHPLGTSIVCNIGDLLARWTNNKYRSTLHRVLAPKRGVHRYSIPFFNPGNPSFPIKTIYTCLAEGETPQFDTITAGEYITSKHMESTGAKKV